MPLYDLRCDECGEQKEVEFKLADAPAIGDKVEVEELKRCQCGSFKFTRVWPNRSAIFQMNFRRTGM